jgi:hypothetical protein
MNKMRLLLQIWVIAVMNVSCNWILDVKELGDKIFLDYDIILRTEKTVYDGVGICMIPPTVQSVNFDKRFVIVRSLNNNNLAEYWLIDKEQECQMLDEIPSDSLHQIYYRFSNLYGPLDSIAFLNLKKEKAVSLDW